MFISCLAQILTSDWLTTMKYRCAYFMFDVISVSYNWWRHNGDHHRHPIPLPLRCDQVTLCLYNDLVQIKGIAVVLSMVLQFCAWINSRIHGSKQGVTINIDIYIFVIDSINWYMSRKNEYSRNSYWYFVSGNFDLGMEKSWKSHGTFFWDFCGNPEVGSQKLATKFGFVPDW